MQSFLEEPQLDLFQSNLSQDLFMPSQMFRPSLGNDIEGKKPDPNPKVFTKIEETSPLEKRSSLSDLFK